MYKAANNMSPEIMRHLLPLRESLRYPTRTIFKSSNIKTSTYGINSLAYLGPRIWAIIPDDIKKIPTLTLFKTKIKQWNPDNCPCKLCKTYVAAVGYID